MTHPVTLFTGQWADLPLEELCRHAKEMGYDGLELACWGDHFDVWQAVADDTYCERKIQLLDSYGLRVFAISNHLVGQAVCDDIDARHRAILPQHVWGDGNPEGVRQRAAQEMMRTAQAAARLGVKVVNGFTGSSIWRYLYSFPPVPKDMIDAGFEDFARRWRPVLDEFQKYDVRFALEVHPTEIAFDIVTAQRALDVLDYHPAFGFNFDPSHLAYQGVDYIEFLRRFHQRIFHVHMKDVTWAPAPALSGVFGGHLDFGDPRRYWDFRSLGRGRIDFEAIIRALHEIHYTGPLSVEWEDAGMDRFHGAREACAFVRRLDFPPSAQKFDAAFSNE
ncbi:MAG: sugar phosphate isomerase/epimerase [Candidatus Sumerlaea chitinivorans]|uniref:Inosose isomerase n=1 Tax=Sumerlaea chitinivorans TaxID=2250252 RepID=A0A2Z4Y5G7_SUMC1|nr:Inosose isomerase [Candidatus Sumerlaea chitinivorans]MCX7964569.1 sugar phosphate isomerase/epimerase [Candidatus Sumerlaea chitinivorans]